MQDQSSPRRFPLGVVAGFSALALVTGSAVAFWSYTTTNSRLEPPAKVESQPNAQSNSQSNAGQPVPPIASDRATSSPPANRVPLADEKTLQVYWLKGTGNEIALVGSPVKLSVTSQPEAIVTAALKQLLAGPNNSHLTTTIPPQTQLRRVDVREDGIHIDLSKEFTNGGGSASMTGRVAQVLHTATSLNPQAAVWLSVEGKPLETLGGEGLVLEQPLTRENFKRDFAL